MEELNDTLTLNNLYCSYCDVTLTNDARYKAHIGTKKHKRNIREARKVIREGGHAALKKDPIIIDPNLTPQEVLELSDHKGPLLDFYRQKVNDYEDFKWTYAHAFLAYCSADLALNPTVETFTITINNQKITNSFSDAVLQVRFMEFPEKDAFTSFSLVHFRNVNSNIDYTIDSATQGKFTIQDILSEAEKLDYNKLESVQDNPKSKEVKLKFSVVTTWKPSPVLEYESTIEFCPVCIKSKASHSNPCPGVLNYEQIRVKGKPLKKKPLIMLNTSEYNENILRFWYIPTAIPSTLDNNKFPHLYLYTSQRKLADFPQAIENMLTSRLGTQPPDGVADDFMAYITKWAESNKYGLYKLTKENVLVKLGELLLEQYRCPMQFQIFPSFTVEETSEWVRAVKSHDIVVLDKQEDLPYLLEPWHKLTETKLTVNMNATSSCFDISPELVENQLRQKTKSNEFLWRYLIEECPTKQTTSAIRLPLENVYNVMWKAGLMPLVLKPNSDQLQTMVEVLECLKAFGLTRRYFVVTSEAERLRTFTANLKVFANLGDLKPETLSKLNIYAKEDVLNFKRDINSSDGHFKLLLTPKHFFKTSLRKSYLKMHPKSKKEEPPEEHIKLVLEGAVMNRIRGALGEQQVNGIVKTTETLRGIDPALLTL